YCISCSNFVTFLLTQNGKNAPGAAPVNFRKVEFLSRSRDHVVNTRDARSHEIDIFIGSCWKIGAIQHNLLIMHCNLIEPPPIPAVPQGVQTIRHWTGSDALTDGQTRINGFYACGQRIFHDYIVEVVRCDDGEMNFDNLASLCLSNWRIIRFVTCLRWTNVAAFNDNPPVQRFNFRDR